LTPTPQSPSSPGQTPPVRPRPRPGRTSVAPVTCRHILYYKVICDEDTVHADMNASSAELRLVDRSGAGSRVGAARLFSSLMALNPVDRGTLAASILDP